MLRDTAERQSRSSFNVAKSLPHKISSTSDNDEANTGNNKKIIRRDTERQRRQKMAILNASLRSLLPVEMIMGKRSLSDHMSEAVNYIKYLKNKLEELSVRSNKLKELSNFSVLGLGNQRSDNNLQNRVMVHPCWDGVEIVITSNVNEDSLLLSEVLEILLEEALSVVTCSSTKANERLIYTIQAKVNDFGCGLDLHELQRKLNALVMSSTR
ncbi:hypothetical protein F2P56_001081 [Juglans regia]|uniref:Transcription factor bHLH36-like n=2 Tax=Juglans regia TaxID=51240 RepID=A0A2I4FG85_JUGRE|nr:transcription factor bHLH36-like [Juglans regia]KAF5480321.1 hypothetical protein F2P56_001081 [Juglans regia]